VKAMPEQRHTQTGYVSSPCDVAIVDLNEERLNQPFRVADEPVMIGDVNEWTEGIVGTDVCL